MKRDRYTRELRAQVDFLVFEGMKASPRALYTLGCLDAAARVLVMLVSFVLVIWWCAL